MSTIMRGGVQVSCKESQVLLGFKDNLTLKDVHVNFKELNNVVLKLSCQQFLPGQREPYSG